MMPATAGQSSRWRASIRSSSTCGSIGQQRLRPRRHPAHEREVHERLDGHAGRRRTAPRRSASGPRRARPRRVVRTPGAPEGRPRGDRSRHTAPRGQRRHRRPARGVRRAARAGGRQPVHGPRVPAGGGDDPRPPVPVEELVRSGRVRGLRGIGRASRRSCASSSRPGRSPSWPSSSASSRPGSSGSAATSGWPRGARWRSPARSASPRRRSCARPRRPAGCATCPASGRSSRRSCSTALAREGAPRPPRGLLLAAARELAGGIAAALGGEAAGDARRWRDACERLAVVCAARGPGAAARRASPRCRRSSR